MKKSRYAVTAAAAIWMVIGLGMTARAKSVYRLETENQYDNQGVSRDDNDKNKVYPLEPDVYVSEEGSNAIEMLLDVSWSEGPENWTASNDVTGTVYLGSSTGFTKSSLEIKVVNSCNDAQITSVKKYTDSDYETDSGYMYTAKSTYQVAAQLDSITWAERDSDNPSVATWNNVKSANTHHVVLYDDQGSVVSQIMEGAISYSFSPFMTKPGTAYYFKVITIAKNRNQQDYLKDGEPASSLSSQSNDSGTVNGIWGDYRQGWRSTYHGGTVIAGKWERIMSKWYYFSPEGYAVTGRNELDGKWYHTYQDGSMIAGAMTPDGYQAGGDGAWVQQTAGHVQARVNVRW